MGHVTLAPEISGFMAETGGFAVTSVKMVEIRMGFEVAIGHAALGGSCRLGSGSATGMRSSAMASTCM